MRHRKKSLVVILGFMVVCGIIARDVRLDFSVENFFQVLDPALQTYRDFKRDFPQEDGQVALFWQEDGVSLGDLASGMREAESLFASAGLRDITWFGNTRVASTDAEDTLTIEFLTRGLPLEQPATEVLRPFRDERAFLGVLWNASQDIFVLSGTLSPERNTDLGRKEVENSLTEGLRTLKRPGRTLLLNGLPILRARYLKDLAADQNMIMVAALLLILGVLYLVFRRFSEVLLSLFVTIPAYLFLLAVMVMLDRPMTVLTSSIPVVLLIIGLSDNIHILVHVRARRAEGMGRDEAIVTSMAELAIPCWFTALTTAVGFLSLATTRIGIVVDFAMFATLGILMVYVCSMTMLPPIMALLPTPRGKAARGAVGRGWMNHLIETTLGLAERRPRTVIAIIAVPVMAAIVLGAGLEVNAYLIDDVKPEHPIRQDLTWIEDAGFGLFQVNVYLQGDEQHPVDGAESLRWMRAFQEFAQDGPLVLRSLSPADLLFKVRSDFLGKASGQGLPASDEEARQLVVLGEMTSERFGREVLHAETQRAQVMLAVPDAGSAQTLPALRRLQEYLDMHPAPVAEATITGTVPLIETVYEKLVAELWSSLLTDFSAIFLLMLWMFRSARMGLIGLIPNVIPLLLLFGVQRLLGYDVKPSTILVFSIAYGIATDDTIHILGALKRLAGRGIITAAHIRQAVREGGIGAIVTTLVVCIGFGVLTMSRFEVLFLMGLLTGICLFMALLVELFLLPALLFWVYNKAAAPEPVVVAQGGV